MPHSERPAAAFEFDVTVQSSGVVLLEWAGHIDVAGLRRQCEHLDGCVRDVPTYVLVIDATRVTSYDLEARPVAREWARSENAMRVRGVAIVADSQLAVVESPAAALAPPGKARVFGSRRAALAFAGSADAFPSSGEYTILRGHSAARAVGED
jgi:hypothetical protein